MFALFCSQLHVYLTRPDFLTRSCALRTRRHCLLFIHTPSTLGPSDLNNDKGLHTCTLAFRCSITGLYANCKCLQSKKKKKIDLVSHRINTDLFTESHLTENLHHISLKELQAEYCWKRRRGRRSFAIIQIDKRDYAVIYTLFAEIRLAFRLCTHK